MAARTTKGIAAMSRKQRAYSRINAKDLDLPVAVNCSMNMNGDTDGRNAPASPKCAQDDTEEDDDDRGNAEIGAPTGRSEETDCIYLLNGNLGAKKKKKRKPKKKKREKKTQTSPPRVAVSTLFPNGQYPEGEVCEYKGENSFRTTSEEKRHLDRMHSEFLQEYRQGAEVHRQVRQWAQRNIKPGQTLTDIAEGIEDSVRALTGHLGLEEGDNVKGGMGFPTGLSLNHCAAHYTPNAGNKMVLQQDDVMKVDFGTHINGRIVDSAFTMIFNPVYENLLAAVKDATNTGVRVGCEFLPTFIHECS